MKKAYYISDKRGPETGAEWRLYKLEPGGILDPCEYVIISAVIERCTQEPETYIFPANKAGEVLDWIELTGSYIGGLSHETALHNAGYWVAEYVLTCSCGGDAANTTHSDWCEKYDP